MRKNLLTLAVLAPLASVGTVVHAADLSPEVTFGRAVLTSAVSTPDSLTFNFSGLSLDGFQFTQLVGPLAGFTTGTLTGVSVNATLDASVGDTYADDLTIYVDVEPLSTGGLLQVGGFSNLSALERHSWANGGSSSPGTTVIDSVTLTTPISFAGTAADPVIWLGNGYGAAGANGTWTGSVTLTISAVPEATTWSMFAAGGLGLAMWMRRRRTVQNA